jgi:hypothetical protein
MIGWIETTKKRRKVDKKIRVYWKKKLNIEKYPKIPKNSVHQPIFVGNIPTS